MPFTGGCVVLPAAACIPSPVAAAAGPGDTLNGCVEEVGVTTGGRLPPLARPGVTGLKPPPLPGVGSPQPPADEGPLLWLCAGGIAIRSRCGEAVEDEMTPPGATPFVGVFVTLFVRVTCNTERL